MKFQTRDENLMGYLVVRDYPDIFPDDLPDLKQRREIDFIIDMGLRTKPILKVPYRMVKTELVELRMQLGELFELGFDQPTMSHWGALVLFF